MAEKTILITGASSGFGEACARIFASPGHRLILTARRLEKLEQLKKELAGKCPVHTVQLDVRDRTAVEKVIAALPDEFRAIDVLVNNAGLALGLEPSHKVDIEDWEVMVDTNVKGLMYCTRAILPGMVERNQGTCRQYQLNRRDLAISRWQRLWRHQGLCHAVLTQPACRPDRYPGEGNLYPARHGGNGILQCALQGQRRGGREGLRRHGTDVCHGYCRSGCLGGQSPGTPEYQQYRDDACLSGLGSPCRIQEKAVTSC